LQAKLTGSEKQMIASQPTSDTAAYELYHKGRSLWAKRSGDNIPKAVAFYEQAIARDPNYALAYAGLADAYVLLPSYTSASQRDAYPKAKAAALKALKLDPNLAEAHTAVGKIHNFVDIDNQASIHEFERAIELKPNDATAHHWIGSGPLVNLGRFDEAMAHGKRAVELDPLSQIMNTDYGSIFLYAGKFDEAIGLLRKALDLDPTFGYGNQVLATAYQAKGDLPNAIAQFEKAKQFSDDPVIIAQLAAAKALAGDKNAAQKTLAELDTIAQQREVVAYARALLYLSLGNKPEALRWLEQGFAERDGGDISAINVDPMLVSLHGDPRFEALVQKVVSPK
jgi:tetratricopeptide (TPR) repeat protein